MPDEACKASPGEIIPTEAPPDGIMAAPRSSPHGLVLVSTPIGNLGDVSNRAREVLRQSDLILCEDTRHSARLLTAIGVSARTEPLHEHNEDARIAPVLAGPPEGNDAEDLDGSLLAALKDHSVREAAALVTAATGLPRKVVYARALVLARDL